MAEQKRPAGRLAHHDESDYVCLSINQAASPPSLPRLNYHPFFIYFSTQLAGWIAMRAMCSRFRSFVDISGTKTPTTEPFHIASHCIGIGIGIVQQQGVENGADGPTARGKRRSRIGPAHCDHDESWAMKDRDEWFLMDHGLVITSSFLSLVTSTVTLLYSASLYTLRRRNRRVRSYGMVFFLGPSDQTRSFSKHGQCH